MDDPFVLNQGGSTAPSIAGWQAKAGCPVSQYRSYCRKVTITQGLLSHFVTMAMGLPVQVDIIAADLPDQLATTKCLPAQVVSMTTGLTVLVVTMATGVQS